MGGRKGRHNWLDLVRGEVLGKGKHMKVGLRVSGEVEKRGEPHGVGFCDTGRNRKSEAKPIGIGA